MPFGTNGGAAGGGSSSGSSGSSSYSEVSSTSKQLSASDQLVKVKSDMAHSEVIMPYSTDISNGHYVDLFRDEGSFNQMITSHDALVGNVRATEKEPEAHLHLVGGSADASPNAYFPVASDNVTFTNDDVLGASHSVMRIDDSAEEFEGVLLDEELVPSSLTNWTIFGRFKHDGSDFDLSSGLFTIGNPTSQGYAMSLIFKSPSKVKLWFGKDGGSEMSLTFNSMGSTLLDGDWHNIAITNTTNGLAGLEIYVDDMDTPIGSSTINGGAGVMIRGDGFSVGHARHTDASNAPFKGYYSNWQVYQETLTADDRNALKDAAVVEESNLAGLGNYETLRVIYDQPLNEWQLHNFVSPETRARGKAVSNISQSIPVSNTGAVVDFEVEKTMIDMSLSNGEIEFLSDGLYNLDAHLELNMKDVTTSGEVEAWIEKREAGSSTWDKVADTGRHTEFIAVTLTDPGTSTDISFKTDGNFTFSEKAMEIKKGDKLRIKIRGDVANLTLLANTLANGVAAPSARLSIVKE